MKAYLNNGYTLDSNKQKTIRWFHKDGEPPYSVSKLAKLFGIEKLYSGDLPYNISGCIKKIGKEDQYEIVLNSGESYNRRRFTAAHELAHFLLHKDDIGDGIKDDALYRSKLSTIQEVEANKLAADILMPLDKIYEILGKDKRLAELSSIFEVSNLAMCIRLGVNELTLLSS